MNKKIKVLISAVCIIAVIGFACGLYFGDYYHADSEAVAAFAYAHSTERQICENGDIVYAPEEVIAGLIFYPGGKVEHTAYEPLMKACAQKGILCVLTRMPFNLAVFDSAAAEGIAEKYPDIEKWYIGGHSLGGSMAAAYVSENADDFEGLILLASYSTADLSDTSLEVLSIYGSEDKVLTADKYEENKQNLPDNFNEIIIDGGCHAYFGMYGEQKGDGEASITPEEQIIITADAIAEMII